MDAAKKIKLMTDDDEPDIAATERALHVPALIVLAMFIIVTYVVWFCVCLCSIFLHLFLFIFSCPYDITRRLCMNGVIVIHALNWCLAVDIVV